jgi:hypothetical protein
MEGADWPYQEQTTRLGNPGRLCIAEYFPGVALPGLTGVALTEETGLFIPLR